MPRAVIATHFGAPETFALKPMTAASLRPHEVRVRIRAAGVSFVDALIAAGQYQVRPQLPFIPGTEGAGIVAEVGELVSQFTPGDMVTAVNFGGMFAEEVILPAESLSKCPNGMAFEEAAVLQVSYTTAWHALVDRAGLRPGETLLVLGAGGATGFAAVQIGKYLGAKVIASAGSDVKRVMALNGGADAAVDARAEDWRKAVSAVVGPQSVDVVFDPVGGAATELAFRTLGWKGRHLVVGFPGGIASLKTNLPLVKGASLIGVDVRQFGVFEPEKSAANKQEVFNLAAAGLLRPKIQQQFALEDFALAMNAASKGDGAGRIVIAIN